MPTRDIVTEELCKIFKSYLEESYIDFKRYRCNSTLRNLISTLYETAILYFTFTYNRGARANYSDVKKNLPNEHGILQLQTIRDDIIHNLQNVTPLREIVGERLLEFGEENFQKVLEVCELKNCTMYEDILKYCGYNKLEIERKNKLEDYSETIKFYF